MKRVIFLFCAFTILFLVTPGYVLGADDIDPDLDMLKPKIEYVRVDSITKDSSGYFNILHYTVRWRGDNRLGVGVGEYYEGMLTLVVNVVFRDYREYAFEEDGVTYYQVSRDTGVISPDCYAYIDFCVQNKWGGVEYEIELLPGGILSAKEIPEEDIAGEDIFEVFDCGGRRIGTFTCREDIKDSSPKGLLIVSRIRNNAVISTEKFLNR